MIWLSRSRIYDTDPVLRLPSQTRTEPIEIVCSTLIAVVSLFHSVLFFKFGHESRAETKLDFSF